MNPQIPLSGRLAVAGNRIAALVSFFIDTTWRRPRGPKAIANSLTAKLEISREQGWPFLDLVLVNQSFKDTWVEEVIIALSELSAELQSDRATCHGLLKLRTLVVPGETLRISLVETVYMVSGRPQGFYSFVAFGLVRYRMNDEWSEVVLPPYRITMCALTPMRLQQVESSRQADELPEVRRMVWERTIARIKQDRLEQAPLGKQGVGR